MTRDIHVGYLDLELNLVTFQYVVAFGCYHFCLNRFGLELIIFLWNSSQLSVQFWDCRIPETFVSVLGLQVAVGLQINSGLQPTTRWEPFVAGAMLCRPEPIKERVEPTIFSLIAIEIRHLTRFALLLQLRILRYMCRNHVGTWE